MLTIKILTIVTKHLVIYKQVHIDTRGVTYCDYRGPF